MKRQQSMDTNRISLNLFPIFMLLDRIIKLPWVEGTTEQHIAFGVIFISLYQGRAQHHLHLLGMRWNFKTE